MWPSRKKKEIGATHEWRPFENAAESWIKNITISKARNWPLILQSVTRFEVRDSHFLGTWAGINNGSNAYLGWIDATDSLMDNVQARDLRHMAIFQLANRCIIRSRGHKPGDTRNRTFLHSY